MCIALQQMFQNNYYYLLTELGKLLYKSNILHITSYFLKNVIYYSYILLKIKCNLILLHIKLLNKRLFLAVHFPANVMCFTLIKLGILLKK